MPYKDPEKQKYAQRQHYLDNKDIYAKKNKTYRERVRDYVKEVKESSPCLDCGEWHPYYVMEFDHLHSKEKTVSWLASKGTMKQVIEEIKKCELVCSNCHKKRTWNRLQK
jgi:GTP1/Obg family GTP-binding protein